MRIQTLNNWY